MISLFLCKIAFQPGITFHSILARKIPRPWTWPFWDHTTESQTLKGFINNPLNTQTAWSSHFMEDASVS